MSPTRPPRPCAVPGCPELVRAGGPCVEHRRAADVRRGSSSSRGYNREWNRTRLFYLRDRAPRNSAGDAICENCGRTAEDAGSPLHIDHIDGLGPTGPRGHDLDNLQALCAPCHGSKTAHQTGTAGGPNNEGRSR